MNGKYALIIGNTEYSDPGLAQLSAPGKDAEDFARVLGSPEIAGFDRVFTLINKDVFLVNQAIEDFFTGKKSIDLLLLYFSGHGVRDENGALYLAVKNTNRTRLRSTAVNSAFIRDAMDQSRSKRQILILDCCNSGAFAQGTKSILGGTMGTAQAFEGTGYGRVVLTASDATQFAWEGEKVIGDTDNSLFTHFLVKGLEGDADHDGDGRISVDELYDYAYGEIVNQTSNQTPGKWSYKQQGEIYLRESTAPESIRATALPADLLAAAENTLPLIREGAVKQLEQLLKGKNQGLARSARLALEKIAAEDDSRRIAQLAKRALETADEPKRSIVQEVETPVKKTQSSVPPQEHNIPVPKTSAVPRASIPPTSIAHPVPAPKPQWKISPPWVSISVLLLFCISGGFVGMKVLSSLLAGMPEVTPLPSSTDTVPVVGSTKTRPTFTSTFPPVPQVTDSPSPTPPATDTSTPTVTPFSPQEPEQFINYYFETIIYERNYDLAWSLLSRAFRETNNPVGFEDWKKTWASVVEWRRPTWTVTQNSPAKAVVSCPEIWFRASQWYTLTDRRYCLVKDESRNTWIIEQKAVCGL